MRIEVGEERKEINIPISEVVGDGGKLNIFPNVKKYFSIDYKPQGGKLTLVAGGHIGLIPINQNLAVEIRPKFAVSNLARIVAIAEDNFNTLDFFSKKYQEITERTPEALGFMAESLAKELETLEAEGIFKNYTIKTKSTHNLKGRISINQSIKHLWSHGHFNKATVNHFEFSPDNIFNRLIKNTLHYLIGELDIIKDTNGETREKLIRFYELFELVPLVQDLHSLIDVSNEIKSEKIPSVRNYYINICEICRLIINGKGISFDESGGDVLLNSFTLDMGIIFEKYMLNSVRCNRSVYSSSMSILDGNKEGKKRLYDKIGFDQADAKPDIIFKDNGVFKIIADAKYKIKSKEDDRYQVISHALSYGANVAVLILPKDGRPADDRLVWRGSLGSEFKIDVYEYYFDLSVDDLKEEERNLALALSSLLP